MHRAFVHDGRSVCSCDKNGSMHSLRLVLNFFALAMPVSSLLSTATCERLPGMSILSLLDGYVQSTSHSMWCFRRRSRVNPAWVLDRRRRMYSRGRHVAGHKQGRTCSLYALATILTLCIQCVRLNCIADRSLIQAALIVRSIPDSTHPFMPRQASLRSPRSASANYLQPIPRI